VPNKITTPRRRLWARGAFLSTAATPVGPADVLLFLRPPQHSPPTVSAAATALTWRRRSPSAGWRRWPTPPMGNGRHGATVRRRRTRICPRQECSARCTTDGGASRSGAQAASATLGASVVAAVGNQKERNCRKLLTSLSHPPYPRCRPAPPPPHLPHTNWQSDGYRHAVPFPNLRSTSSWSAPYAGGWLPGCRSMYFNTSPP